MKRILAVTAVVCASIFSAQAATTGGVDAIYSKVQFDDVLATNEVVVVDFYATWCGPCKRLAPTYAALADEFAGRAKFVKIDGDRNTSLTQKYNVHAYPTLMYFKNGSRVLKGKDMDRSKAHLRSKVDSLLN